MSILNSKLIEPNKLHQDFLEIAKTLKNCLEDDWVAEIRFAAVLLLRKMIDFCKDELTYDDF
jgi:hypothetical protein